MSPAFFSAVAVRLFTSRWQLLGVSMLGTVLAFGAFSFASPRLAIIPGMLAGPLVIVPWALLCACIWFHPQHGNLQPQSKLVGNLPRLLQIGMRWYAAVFLGLFMFFGTVVWPVLSITWL